MPTRIFFGSGLIDSLKKIIDDEIGSTRPLLITDKGLLKTGIIEKVATQTKMIDIFDEIQPNPKSTTINKAGEIARKLKPNLIIAVGGGSSLDAGKAIALLATNKGRIEDYEGLEKYINTPLPVFTIPTTCGTGSEVTWVSIITDTKRKIKMSVKGHKMFPVAALIDPDLLKSLPQPIIATTGLDALTHAIEAYTSKPATFISDLFALKAIDLISDSLYTSYKDIHNEPEARANIMLGSTLAGIAFNNSDVGAVHCISESIGGLFDISHGVANSIFLPYVMKFNLPACRDKYATIASTVGIDETDKNAAAQKLIQKITTLSHSVDIPSFKDLRIDRKQFSLIARHSYQNNSNPSNPRDITIGDYLGIINEAYNNS